LEKTSSIHWVYPQATLKKKKKFSKDPLKIPYHHLSKHQGQNCWNNDWKKKTLTIGPEKEKNWLGESRVGVEDGGRGNGGPGGGDS